MSIDRVSTTSIQERPSYADLDRRGASQKEPKNSAENHTSSGRILRSATHAGSSSQPAESLVIRPDTHLIQFDTDSEIEATNLKRKRERSRSGRYCRLKS